MYFDWICSSQKTPKKRCTTCQAAARKIDKTSSIPLGETTDLAWRATIDKFYFTWHGEILNLLRWKVICLRRGLSSRNAVITITAFIHYCSAREIVRKWVKRCRNNRLSLERKWDCILQNDIAVLDEYCSFWVIFLKCLPSRFFIFNCPFCMWCTCIVGWSESMWRGQNVIPNDMHMHLKKICR
jgi:hypothetical protein